MAKKMSFTFIAVLADVSINSRPFSSAYRFASSYSTTRLFVKSALLPAKAITMFGEALRIRGKKTKPELKKKWLFASSLVGLLVVAALSPRFWPVENYPDSEYHTLQWLPGRLDSTSVLNCDIYRNGGWFLCYSFVAKMCQLTSLGRQCPKFRTLRLCHRCTPFVLETLHQWCSPDTHEIVL